MTTRLLAAGLVGGAIVVWAWLTSPSGALAGGVALFLLTPVAVAAAGVATRSWPAGGALTAHLPALAAGAAATAAIWLRVWSRPYVEESGIMPALFNLFAFWFPGLLVAAGALLIERALGAPPAGLTARILMGLAAGIVGMLLFFLAGATWFRVVDRYALDDEVARSVGTTLGRSTHVLRDGILEVSVVVGDGDLAPALRARQWAARARDAAFRLVVRRDTDRVVVVARTPDGNAAVRVEVTDADDRARLAGSPPPKPDLTGLAGGGMLDEASLRMLALAYHDPASPDPIAEWNRRFAARLEPGRVVLALDLPDPASAGGPDWWAAGFGAVNDAVNGILEWFDEHPVVDVTTPGGRVEVETDGLAVPFHVQPRLPGAPAFVLAFEVTRDGTATGAGGFEPGDFAAPAPDFQVAVRSVQYGPPAALTGFLYETIRLQPGALFVIEVDEDGSALVVLDNDEGLRTPPTRLSPGQTLTAGALTLHHLGTRPRADFG